MIASTGFDLEEKEAYLEEGGGRRKARVERQLSVDPEWRRSVLSTRSKEGIENWETLLLSHCH